MTSQASRFIGSIPENYDHGIGPHVFYDYGHDLAHRVAKCRPKSVLELAAGTGIVTRMLRDAISPTCELISSDLNPPMLEVAQAKFEPGERVQFEQIDAIDIGFDAARFDVVVCQFGVMFFPDKDRSYREVRRVLRPGGTYVFNTWDSWAENPFARIAHEVLASFFPNDPPGFYRVPFSYFDPDAIRASLVEAGFGEVSIKSLSFQSKIPSASRFAQGLIFGNPAVEEIKNRGGDPKAIRDSLSEAIQNQLGSEMPLRALVVEATTV
ncbi:MAG: class I SAM-dependent methyltransferase [Myxococcales bacterium]|nr:class I SAM-dependent methyltransferase [Myxococcales bacterium]